MAVNENTNILIVDDYKTMLRVVRNLLNQIGLKNVDEATDGTMALEMINSKKYDLIISDWNMEPMSGYDLLKSIRTSSSDRQKTPFIMVTAENKTENIVAAKQAGVNNYILKPFSAETLKTKITAVMGGIGMLEQSFKRDQVAQIIGSLVQRITVAPTIDNSLLQEVDLLKDAIDQMREALNFAHPDQIQSHIPSATDELDAIVSTTENATNTIMSACEEIQNFIQDKPLEESAPIENEIIRIIEACTFQDLTGQRITKIIKSLHEIERRANELSGVLKDRFADLENKSVLKPLNSNSLLNGPQLPGQGISQDEIDNLLNDFA